MISSNLKRYVTFFLIIGTACQMKTQAQEKKKPHIVFILADDLGYGDVSVYNPNSKIHTPQIDRIAKEGIMFTDAHSNSSVCTPTRYGILTGRYCWRTVLEQGVLNGYSKALIAENRLTLASMLKHKGYNTACIGKWHLGWRWSKKYDNELNTDFSKDISYGPNSLGFDYFYGISASLDMPPYVYIENNKVVELPDRETENTSKAQLWRKGPVSPDFDHKECLRHFTDKAKNCIKKYSKSKNPFFLYLALPSPHTPILPSDEFKNKSGIGDYGDFVMESDGMIGEITATLKALNIEENTLLIVTSDNGCSPAANVKGLEKLGHYPSAQFRGYKADLYEGGHRVPFIVHWPSEIKNSIVCDRLISTTDILATIAQLTGYKLEDNQGEDSFSFYSFLTGRETKATTRKSMIHHSYYGDFAVRMGDWKLLLTPYSGGWSFPAKGVDDDKVLNSNQYQLFNLKDDFGETTNLSVQNQDVVNELKFILYETIQNGRSTKGKKQQNDRIIELNF
jgi:arylsulfatase A